MDRVRVRPRAAAALAAGRAAGRLSQALGRGSGSIIGGRIALRAAPSALAELAAGRRTVLVTGTNGKSTTTALVAAALEAAGPVACNRTGANMPDGILTALAADRTSRLAAIEVDEVYLREAVAATAPEALVVLNAYREYTRGISLAATLEHWRAVAERLDERCTVVLNVDDPLVCWAFEAAPRRVGVAGGLSWRDDAALCPACGEAHAWDGTAWHCPGCGRTRPAPDWWVAPGAGSDGWAVHHPGGALSGSVGVPGRTGPVGAAFALAAVGALGVPAQGAGTRVGAVQDVDGRYRPFEVGGRIARLLMLKNPAGWAEAIAAARDANVPVVLAVDRFGPKDTTTMWEAPFSQLAGGTVPVTGARAADAGAVLEAAGVPSAEHADARAALRACPPGEVLVLCNYPAFRRLSRTLAVAP
jgi:UDP-N-acetylmuramyl tripeptide synthase